MEAETQLPSFSSVLIVLERGQPNLSSIINPTLLAWCGTTICAAGATSLVPGLDASKVSIITHNDVQATDGTSALGSVHLVTVRIGPDDPANGNDPRAVWFESFLPYTFASFRFSPVTITMAWSVT